MADTKIPWCVAGIRSMLWYAAARHGPWEDCDQHPEGHGMPTGEDAPLLAAAPELYAALEGLLRDGMRPSKQAAAYTAALTALDRARGEL